MINIYVNKIYIKILIYIYINWYIEQQQQRGLVSYLLLIYNLLSKEEIAAINCCTSHSYNKFSWTCSFFIEFNLEVDRIVVEFIVSTNVVVVVVTYNS